MSESDRVLARALLAGDPAALDRFFEEHVPRLYRFARRRLRGRTDLIEDVVQETLVKIIEKLDGFRGESALSTWMCTVCWRVILDRRTRDRRLAETPLVDDDADFRAVDTGPERPTDDPEAAVLEAENARQVHEVLDELPEPYGNVLEWKYIHGWSVKRIAAQLGLSPKAAESTLTRARQACRKAFEALSSDPQPGAAAAAARRTGMGDDDE